MILDRKWWLPPLYYDHGGFFKVILSLLLVHAGLMFDSLRSGPARSPSFAVIRNFLGDQMYLLAPLHAIVFVLIVAGLYCRERFFLLRYGCALSLVLFNVLAVGFAFAAYEFDLSYYVAIASVTLSMSSFAAIKEPTIQSARRD